MLTVKIFGYAKDQLALIASNYINTRAIQFDIDEIYLDARLTLTNLGESEECFNSITSDILLEVRDNLYGQGDVTLGEMAIEYLNYHSKKLAIAESLTGGLISNAIVEIDGASKVLFESLVTYDNDSKIKRLGVSRYTIERHGAVSYECAHEMAHGLLKSLDVDVALSTTGIAGPTGGSAEKPIGLTYICVADRTGSKVYDHIFEGDRKSIRNQAANTALFYLINKLKTK